MHLTVFKLSTVLKVLILVAFVFNKDHGELGSNSIKFYAYSMIITLGYVAMGSFIGCAFGFVISQWTKKILVDDQLLVMLPIGSLLVLSLLLEFLSFDAANYSVYTSFCLVFRKYGFPNHKLKHKETIIFEISKIIEQLIKNGTFFILGILLRKEWVEVKSY